MSQYRKKALSTITSCIRFNSNQGRLTLSHPYTIKAPQIAIQTCFYSLFASSLPPSSVRSSLLIWSSMHRKRLSLCSEMVVMEDQPFRTVMQCNNHKVKTWLKVHCCEFKQYKCFLVPMSCGFHQSTWKLLALNLRAKHHLMYLPAISSEESSSCGLLGLLLLFVFSGLALDGSFTRICYLLGRIKRDYLLFKLYKHASTSHVQTSGT